jgi:hypothetical protein
MVPRMFEEFSQFVVEHYARGVCTKAQLRRQMLRVLN